jgi:tetratricopeptide (TPR) repeat protein
MTTLYSPFLPVTAAPSWVERGNLWHQAGDQSQAAACYEQALELDSADSQAWFNLGVVRTLAGELPLALIAYQQAVLARPRFAQAYNNAGILHQALGDTEAAGRCYQKAAQADPTYADPHYNAGLLAFAGAHFSAAERSYRRALQLAPHHAEARNNLGNTLLELGRAREARRNFENVLAAVPDHPEARWNLGFTQLLLGDYAQGWPNYEWRLSQAGRGREMNTPRWDGRDLSGESLLVWNEQGLGDAIQFARFLPAVQARGAQVYFETAPPLKRLFTPLPARLMAPAAGLETHWQIPLLSLPAIFGTRTETIPRAPYLTAHTAHANKFRRLLVDSLPAGHLRVGLAWSGNPHHQRDRQRSLPPALIPALTGDLPGVSFVSVQRGAPPPGVLTFDDQITDFADTAGLMANLDLIVSVDTAAAHLAGALGLPVWLLLSYAPDFRWLLDRDDSPWYPTMRLFRQRRLGDWPHLLARVRAELSPRGVRLAPENSINSAKDRFQIRQREFSHPPRE